MKFGRRAGGQRGEGAFVGEKGLIGLFWLQD